MTRTHSIRSTYVHGCRCDDCRAASREYARAYCSRDIPPPPVRPKIRDLARKVCAEAGVEAYIVMGRNRTAAICRLRELIWHRAHAEGYSLNQIGRVFGRDHTTVMHGIRNEQRRRGEVA